MKTEKLWEAIGNVDPKFIEEAETPPKRAGHRRFGLILAAAVLMLLSVSAIAAAKWYISLDDVFEDPTEELKKDEQLIEATDTKEGTSVSVVSCLADERVMYLLWQLENSGEVFPEGAEAALELSFGEASVNTSLGYFCGQIDELCSGGVLAGYIVADWNAEMQDAKGLFRISRITVPKEVDGENYYPDFVSAMEKSEYSEGEENISSDWPDEYLPAYQFFDIPLYSEDWPWYLDYVAYRDGKLFFVTRREMFGVENEIAARNYILMNSRTGEEVDSHCHLVFADKSGYLFGYYSCNVAYEDIGNLYYHMEGDNAPSTYLKGGWEISFKAEAVLESVSLPSAVPGVTIDCSPISMAISGGPDEIEYIKITLSDGSGAELISLDPGRLIFEKPIEPDKISSIIINDVEYLK